MHFINRLKRYLLVSVLCVTTVFSMPVQAKTKSKSNAQKAAEQAAAAAENQRCLWRMRYIRNSGTGMGRNVRKRSPYHH